MRPGRCASFQIGSPCLMRASLVPCRVRQAGRSSQPANAPAAAEAGRPRASTADKAGNAGAGQRARRRDESRRRWRRQGQAGAGQLSGRSGARPASRNCRRSRRLPAGAGAPRVIAVAGNGAARLGRCLPEEAQAGGPRESGATQDGVSSEQRRRRSCRRRSCMTPTAGKSGATSATSTGPARSG